MSARSVLLAAALASLCPVSMVSAEPAAVRNQPSLASAAARALVARAESAASAAGVAVTVAILDANGTLLAFSRMDGAPLGSVEVAPRKAGTAIRWGAASGEFQQWLSGGDLRLLSLPDTVLIEGGLPIRVDSRVVGAIGVSGGTSKQDVAIAQAALAALP